MHLCWSRMASLLCSRCTAWCSRSSRSSNPAAAMEASYTSYTCDSCGTVESCSCAPEAMASVINCSARKLQQDECAASGVGGRWSGAWASVYVCALTCTQADTHVRDRETGKTHTHRGRCRGRGVVRYRGQPGHVAATTHHRHFSVHTAGSIHVSCRVLPICTACSACTAHSPLQPVNRQQHSLHTQRHMEHDSSPAIWPGNTWLSFLLLLVSLCSFSCYCCYC